MILGFFGGQFITATTSLIILAFGQFFNSITGPSGIILNMTGHEKVSRNIILIIVSLFLLLCYCKKYKTSTQGGLMKRVLIRNKIKSPPDSNRRGKSRPEGKSY